MNDGLKGHFLKLTLAHSIYSQLIYTTCSDGAAPPFGWKSRL